MKSSQLRDLAREFSAGKISGEVYRAKRRELIDGIVAGGVAIQYREIKPVTAFAKPIMNRNMMIAVGAVILLLLVAAVFMLQPAEKPETQAVARAAPEPSPAEIAVTSFVELDDWSEASLSEFESKWAGFSEFHKEAIRRSPKFSRLEMELRSQIKEQHTLAQIGDDLEAGLREARLMMFAERLNIAL